MNNYEEIRNLLKASRTMLGGEKMVKESFEIKKRYSARKVRTSFGCCWARKFLTK